MNWLQSEVSGLAAYSLDDQDWEMRVIPGLGGKICSIRWQGRELLAANPRKDLRPARYGAPYAEFDASGFDECFPSIGPCVYPDYPWAGVEIPDHGELWPLPWKCQVIGANLQLETSGIRIPYQFTKTISIADRGSIRFRYSLSNPTSFPFQYIWSAHPLFALQPGMRIVLPGGTRIRVDWSRDDRLGKIWQEHAWPVTQDRHGSPVDLSLILGPEVERVEKLYTTPLSQGWCALYDPQDRGFAAFAFSPQQVPFVGLSINLGGWPVEGAGYYNLGLEPCSGYPDRLDLAMSTGVSPTLDPFSTVAWEIDLLAGKAEDEAALISRLSHAARSLDADRSNLNSISSQELSR